MKNKLVPGGKKKNTGKKKAVTPKKGKKKEPTVADYMKKGEC